MKTFFHKSSLVKNLHNQKFIQLYIYTKHLHPSGLLPRSFDNDLKVLRDTSS